MSVVRSLGLERPLDWAGIVQDGRILRTRAAVIGGLLYNYLPFMVLPIYVALEKIDVRLVDAANDLYATPRSAFRRVVLPLSLPGVFAGTLLTFIPAVGDFINPARLGGPENRMIGNVVQDQFLVQLNYPIAAALSFVLMAIITVAVLVYAKLLGTEGLSV
jgi:spermidine/putrescine transport system permease protein